MSLRVAHEPIAAFDNSGLARVNYLLRMYATAINAKIPDTYIDAREYVSVNAAVTAIGSTAATLVVSNTQTLTANLTIPATLSLVILKGGSIVKASTYTVTINGSFCAGLYQVFSGFNTTDIVFGSGTVDEVYPEWWGAEVNDTSSAQKTTNTTAIQSAINSTKNRGQWVSLSMGKYFVDYPAGQSYVFDIPVYTPSSTLSSVFIRGTGSTIIEIDVADTNHFGTAICISDVVASKPIFTFSSSRSVEFRDLALLGDDKTTASSLLVNFVDTNQNATFTNVSFAGAETAVKIGSGVGNNDFLTFNNCRFYNLVNAVKNYGLNSYQTRMNNCISYESVANIYVCDGSEESNAVMNDFKAKNCFFGLTGTVIKIQNATQTLGISSLEDCLCESVTSGFTVFDNTGCLPNYSCGIIIKGCNFNIPLTSALINSTVPFIVYRGRGSFVFFGNMVTNGYKIIFDIDLLANTINSGAVRIEDNWFHSKPLIKYDIADAFPSITYKNNYWAYFPLLTTDSGDFQADASGISHKENLVEGIAYNIVESTSDEGWRTYRQGGVVLIKAPGDAIYRKHCTVAGTTTAAGSDLSGVTANTTNGSTTVTIASGTMANKARIHTGVFIKIVGVTGAKEVVDCIGTTITIASAADATVSNAAVTYSQPTFVQT